MPVERREHNEPRPPHVNVITLTAPGRFPTVVHDPGRWWSALEGESGFTLVRVSANAAWWRVLCSWRFARIASGSRARQLVRLIRGIDIERSAARAGEALDALSEAATYESSSRYIATVTPLAEHLQCVNRAQRELAISLEDGPQVNGLNYSDSRAVVDYATRRTLLSNLIAAALSGCAEEIGLLIASVTSPLDLLTAMIAVRLLREQRPGMHVCLADHGYENFSLTPFLMTLRTAGTLDTIFDTIIESKDERDTILPLLARALARGETPRGFLRLEHLRSVEEQTREVSRPYVAPPPVPTFASEPIFWMRLSARRCYWSRCTFCVHNAKYDEMGVPSLAEVPAALDRLTALVAAGYGTFIFSDEALSPALLDRFSAGVLERGLRVRWLCRCKLEHAYTPALLRHMRAAGCCEVLFGLESISPRTLRRMDKYVEGLDAPAIAILFGAVSAAGIGLHVNLMAAFPGETPGELIESVAFVSKCLAGLTGATCQLNKFTLFAAAPIMRDPTEFGVLPVPAPGDMPTQYRYCVPADRAADAIAIERLFPELRTRLRAALGWNRFGDGPGPAAAIELYFSTGHSAIIKGLARNPFANPLAQSMGIAHSASQECCA